MDHVVNHGLKAGSTYRLYFALGFTIGLTFRGFRTAWLFLAEG